MLVPVHGKKLEEFTVLQLVGFLILFLGVIFYNEMIVIPFCGLNKYTKEAIAEREFCHEERKSISIRSLY
jgi:hypothetical protein